MPPAGPSPSALRGVFFLPQNSLRIFTVTVARTGKVSPPSIASTYYKDGILRGMLDQRFPSILIIATLALAFSGIGILYEKPSTPLITALIIVQALSLIAAPNHPHISITAYIVAFITALLAGHSTGLEIFLGVFLITIIASIGHHLLAALIIVTITLGGFYSPTETQIKLDLVALVIFLTIAILAYLFGFWVHRNHQHHQRAQHLQQDRRRQLTSLLHDTIAADLTSVIVQLEKLAITASDHQDELSSTAGTARNALNRTRQLLATLNAQPDTRPTPSLPSTLNQLKKRLSDHGFTVESTTELATPVTKTLHNTALERVLSETVTNIIKHATPQSLVTISTTSNDHGVTIAITNACTPTKKPSASTYLGLTSMSNTLHTVGGTLKTHDTNNKWATIAHIPF